MKANVAGVFLFVNTNENDLHLDLKRADLDQVLGLIKLISKGDSREFLLNIG